MEFSHLSSSKATRSNVTLVAVAFLVGIAAGLGGMVLALLLHYIQHIAYGYSPLHIISNETFLEGVRASSYERRITILTLCGIVAGLGWWAVRRYGKPLISIEQAIAADKPHMPLFTTLAHIFLQIITIALGCPLGREVAPRELAVLFTGWLSTKAGLSLKDTRIMLACAAGAGLAAVYNVPLGGALFTLELLLMTWHWSALIPALATSSIAAVVAWIGLGNEPQYMHVPHYVIHSSFVVWSVLAGPLFGFCGYWFKEIATKARSTTPQSWRLPVLCLVNFMVIGMLSIYFPALLGNGKSPARIEFDDQANIAVTAGLLFFHVLVVWSSLRAGARGGLLTPSLASGALLAVLLGGLWNAIWPSTSLGAFALVGATAFLASAQKMPVTAIVLLFEFTQMKFDFLVPILFSVTGAMGGCSVLSRYQKITLEH